jgi:hypothetical protein
VHELAGPPPVLVIDELVYDRKGDGLVAGDCYWCSHPFPAQPVLADRHDGTWKVTVGTKVSSLRQPSGWDGRPPDAGLTPVGGVVVVARRTMGDTVVIESASCRVGGVWALVAADATGVLLHRVDPARLDYSVQHVTACS